VVDNEFQPAERTMLEVLKGQAPAGVAPLDIFKAGDLLDMRLSEGEACLSGLIDRGWARIGRASEGQGGLIFATDATIANPRIAARPWPAAGV